MDDSGDDTPNFQVLSREDLEREVRDRTSYLENLMDTMADVLIELDSDGQIVMVNKACEEALGFSESALAGKPIDYLFAPSEHERLSSMLSRMEFVERLLTDRQLTDVEVVFETADGEAIPMSLSASVMESEDGSVDGIVCVAKDISERKEAEQRAEFLHSLLRHDLGNKLEVTHGNLEVAVHEDYDDVERLLEAALASTEEAIELIRNVRMLEKLEGDEEREAVDLAEAVEEVVSQFDDLQTSTGMDVEVDVASAPDVLAGSLLKELLTNLVENSLRHSEGTVVRIQATGDDETVTLAVEDDGRGVPPDKHETVLEKGQKGNSSTGSGLGTYLARRIAETYGGSLTAGESELGGAKFEVTLPAN
jgi:PAS domain S-box-containing protein